MAKINLFNANGQRIQKKPRIDGVNFILDQNNQLKAVEQTSTTTVGGTNIITSGAYTPVSGTSTNVTSIIIYDAFYTRINNIVTVSGFFIFTSGAGVSSIELSLPITSDLATTSLAGFSSLGVNATILANATNNTATFTLSSLQTSRNTTYSYTYLII